MDIETEKNLRLLQLYDDLISGEGISKKDAAIRFGVNERSIQRDISVLRNFFERQSPPAEINYFPKEGRYRLVTKSSSFFSCGEMVTVCKILLESRSLAKQELEPILDKLLAGCAAPEDRKTLTQILANERFHYIPPRHGKLLTERLWQLGQAIQNRSVIKASYRTQTGEKKQRRLEPVGLMFSEYYFYLTAFIEDIDKVDHFQEADDPFPTIYRVDRLETIEILNEHFSVPYSQRFSEGEFRKRVQFMYGGKLQIVRFTYTGPSIEAVLDRLPTAEIISEQDGRYEIRAEVFGKGIEMWLRSQGELIKVYAPPHKNRKET